ncbi:hypothetical protein AOXY_G6968 [Acipenser oxyrinchus oxyrinchus]|uniref:Uncharacterized protein n=1 Tax=Acipenser oxyrinchus oxyrinchus TaxID=40147 RepID=A0AAD8G9D1_ACIOX|nr:hypothetical protein AOXY_G6968 [Acipenser oxyrinchus oxyrinchus]
MDTKATGFHASFPDLPKDSVLFSGAVTFPGGFDQHGCPLLMFPVLEHNKLNSDLKKEDVVQFISYFLYLHNKHQGGECPISVVLDLRQATLNTTRFITETLLLAQESRKTINTVYAVQPKRKDVKNLLLKSIARSPSKSHSPIKCILLSDVSGLFNYIDRSQLTADLGGYLVYSHRNWVLFIKEIDAFVREFFAVVDRLPSCIAHLQSLSRQPLPNAIEELKLFCSNNEARYSALRRGLGLDELLGRCDRIVEKLRCPEAHLSYRAMAGTSLFAHTAFEMLENHNRITAAVDKVELLWQQALSRAQLPLKNLQHRQEALQIIERINTKGIEKLQSYRIEIAEDAGKAEILQSEYEATIYKPGMELIHHAEDVLLGLSELRGVMERDGGEGAEEDCTEELYRVKEDFRTAIELPHQTLRAVCDFYCFLNQAESWYNSVLHQNFFQDLLWRGSIGSVQRTQYPREAAVCVSPAWKQQVHGFLRKNPSPKMDELIQLAHLANVIPDARLKRLGKQLSYRCLIITKLLTSCGSVSLNELHRAFQWQEEFLSSTEFDGIQQEPCKPMQPDGIGAPEKQSVEGCILSNGCNNNGSSGSKLGLASKINLLTDHRGEGLPPTWESPSHTLSNLILKGTIPCSLSATGKPPSLSSFDSGIDGAGSCHLDHRIVKEAWEMPNRPPVAQEIPTPAPQEPRIHDETVGSMSDSECLEDLKFHSKRCGSSARIQIIPKIISGCLNFEVMVKRSASLPKNPWLSLPLEDLENSYTVTITPTRPSAKCGLQSDLLGSPNAFLETARPLGSCRDSCDGRERSGETQASEQDAVRGLAFTESGIQTEDKSHFQEVQRILENSSELSPIRNVMSSTLNDTRDKPSPSSWIAHTLLWDSYDLHASRKHHEGTRERMGSYSAEIESLFNDWDLKEQEELCFVEKLLVQAADILEEEESVLKQEEVLDLLVKTDSNKHFEMWSIDSDYSADQMHVVPMSSSELVEAGVLGFEDDAGTSGNDQGSGYCPTNLATARDIHSATTIDFNKTAAASLNGSRTFSSSCSSLLQELKELHVIEEQILEENLKIHALQRFEEADGAAPEEQAAGSLLNPSKERELFLRELEKERTEVERMEESLARERAERTTKIRNQLHSGSRKAAGSNPRQSSDPAARSRAKTRLSVTSALTNRKAAVNADKGTPLSMGHTTNWPKENCSKSDKADSGEGISSPSDLVCTNMQTTVSLATMTSIRNDGCPRTPERNVSFCLDEQSQTNGQLEGCSSIHTVATGGLQCVLQSVDPFSRSCVPEESGGTTHSTPALLLTQPVLDIPSENTQKTVDQVLESCELSATESESMPYLTVVRNEIPVPAARSRRGYRKEEPPEPVGDPFDSRRTPAAVVAPIPKPRKASLPSNTDPKNQEERKAPKCKQVTMMASDPVSLKGCTFEPVILEIHNPKHPPKPKERRRKNAVQQQIAGEVDLTLGCILSEKQPSCEADAFVTEIHRDALTTQSEVPNNERNSESCSTPALKSDHVELQARQADCCTCKDSEITKRSTSVEPEREGFRWDCVDAVKGFGERSHHDPVIAMPVSASVGMRAAQCPPVHDSLRSGSLIEVSDYRSPIVLDTGSSLMKAGFADQDLPTTIFPTVIGWPKYKEVMNGRFEREAYIGHDAQHMRGVLSLKYPMQHGIIQNWDEIEKIWHHTFHHQLCVDPEEHPVLLTEAVLNPQENRRRMVEIMFETFHVPLTYVALQAVLALLATGRSTGVVFDSGDGLGHSVPVYEGYGLPHAIQRFHLAGQDITQQLKKLLQERGFSFRTSAELEIVREVKEKCCYVAQDYETELRGSRGPETHTEMYYTLPDGQVINMGNERFRAPEILFKPELVGRDHYGMHESVFRSILRCDMDLRRTFMGNIILSGGNTMLSGLTLRLQEEIRSMVAVDLSDSVRVTSPKDRDFSVWRGGAVLASLPSFSAGWISQGEYEEFGPDIVFRKCF